MIMLHLKSPSRVLQLLYPLLLVLTLSEFPLGKADVIPCNLRHWFPSSKGSQIPENSFNMGVRLTESYVVRTTVTDASGSNPRVYIGTLDATNQTALFPVKNEQTNATASVINTYEILGNPEHCNTQWMKYSPTTTNLNSNHPGAFSPPEFAMRIEGATNKYLGLIGDDQELYYAGEIDVGVSPPVFTYAKGTEMFTANESFQFLTSFSDGIQMRLNIGEIPLVSDGIDPTSTVGSEEIHNDADVEVSQTFIHSKKITEVHETVIKKESVTEKVFNIGIDIGIAGASYKYEHKVEKSRTETWRTEKITDITFTRKITIPPYSAIRACSVITIKENIRVPYTANATYTAPGLEPSEVYQIIKADVPNVILDGDQVVLVNLTGVFQGTVALDAHFYVADLTQGASCEDIQEGAARFKRERVAQMRVQINTEMQGQF